MRKLTLFAATLAMIACSRSNSNTVTRFHEDGRAKPTVSIASMLDTTSFDASWSLSEELTDAIAGAVSSGGQIFVRTQDEAPFTDNPFGADLSWMKREFHGQEFVAFLELVEHEFTPVRVQGETEGSANLNMSVRVRVVDLRAQNPKIVLQEMVKDTYFVPGTLIPNDYAVDTWGTEKFRKSPMGVAHGILTREIAGRISEYILLAKSR